MADLRCLQSHGAASVQSIGAQLQAVNADHACKFWEQGACPRETEAERLSQVLIF